MSREINRLGGRDILEEEDIPSLSQAVQRVLTLMLDGLWHPATDIIQVSGQREGLRRMRDLRSKGFVIERQRRSSTREFYYRLSKRKIPAQEQPS